MEIPNKDIIRSQRKCTVRCTDYSDNSDVGRCFFNGGGGGGGGGGRGGSNFFKDTELNF